MVLVENRVKVLYLQIKKAIYGMIESALFWYALINLFKDMGLEINPYDAYVANKIINGKQCTITWYVNENKVSHVEEKVIDEVKQKIKAQFPGLSIIKGDNQTLIGIKIRLIKKRGLELI